MEERGKGGGEESGGKGSCDWEVLYERTQKRNTTT